MVADPIVTRREDHAGGCYRCNIVGIVTCLRLEVHCSDTKPLGRWSQQCHETLIELQSTESPSFGDFNAGARPLGAVDDCLANLLLHSGKTNHLRVAEVDVELSKVRDDAGQIGFEIEPSGGRLSV